MGLFLTIILVIMLLVGILIRFLPIILARWVNKKMGNTPRKERHGNKVGDVYISQEGETPSDKVVDKDMGEYVDFETVKEKEDA